jgi:hypothetical protein
VSLQSSREGVMLQARPRGGDGDWDTVCEAPCAAVVPIGLQYRIDGDSWASSAPFRVRRGPHRIDATPGYSKLRVGGIVLVPIGGVVLTFGALLIACNTPNGCIDGDGPPNHTGRDRSQDVEGIEWIAGGVALVAIGIALIAANETKVEVDGGSPASASVDLGHGFALDGAGLVF